MDFNEIITFEGGLNTDDTPQGMPKGDYRDFSYCRIGYNSGNAFAVETSDGTIEINNASITVDDKVLGATQWLKENAIVYFVYKYTPPPVLPFPPPPVPHEIWVYYIATQTHQRVVQDIILNFSPDWPIFHANVIDDILKWTDGRWDSDMYEDDGTRLFNPPYQINLRKAIDGFYTIIDLQTIDAIKWPMEPPIVSYFTDTTRNDNKLRGKLFKFIIQPIYENGELGVWSMYSNLALPDQSELVSGTNWVFLNNDNVIRIQFDTGPKVIRGFNLAVQQYDRDSFGTIPPFGVFLQLDKVLDNINDNSFHTVNFYGGVATSAAVDVFKNYDRLPVIADCQEYLPTNQLTYTNFREGYDKPTGTPFTLNVQVGYDVNEVRWNPADSRTLYKAKIENGKFIIQYEGDPYANASEKFIYQVGDIIYFITWSDNDPQNPYGNRRLFYSISQEDVDVALTFSLFIDQNGYILRLIGDSFIRQWGATGYFQLPGTTSVYSTDGIQYEANRLIGFDGPAITSDYQSDGKIIVGGSFDAAANSLTRGICRLNTAGGVGTIGTIDRTFGEFSGTGFNGDVLTVKVQIDGFDYILVGGSFTEFNGVSRNRIARLGPSGFLDTIFDPGTGFNGSVYAIEIQSDNKILVGGDFTSYNGQPVNLIARLNFDGSLDDTFTSPVTTVPLLSSRVLAILWQVSGKIIIGGHQLGIPSANSNNIARLYNDGSYDDTYLANPNSVVRSIVNSTIATLWVYIGGDFTLCNGVSRNRIALLNDIGNLQPSFLPGTGFDDTVRSISVAGVTGVSEWVYCAGNFTDYDSTTTYGIATLAETGNILYSNTSATRINGTPLNISYDGGLYVYLFGNFTYDVPATNLDGRNGVVLSGINFNYVTNAGKPSTDIGILPTGTHAVKNIDYDKITAATPSLKVGATHEFGIVYGDRAYRDSTVYTVDNMNLFVPWFYDIVNSGALSDRRNPFTITPNITINHVPPVWADRYWIVAKPATEILSFGQYITNNNDGTTSWQDSIVLTGVGNNKRYKIYIDNWYERENTGANVRHEIKVGDKLRFKRSNFYYLDYLPYLELDILGVDLNAGNDNRTAVYTNLFDRNIISVADDFGGSDNKLFGQELEIYTPRPSVDDTGNIFVSTWKDITESIPIINPHTEDRSHGSPVRYYIQLDSGPGSDFFYITGDQSQLSGLTGVSVTVHYVDGSVDPPETTNITSAIYDSIENITVLQLSTIGADPSEMTYVTINNQDQVVSALTNVTPAYYAINYGDVYLRLRNSRTGTSGAQDEFYYFMEDFNYSDYYPSDVHNDGRLRIEDQNAKMVHRKASSIHSDSFILGTQINGLSSFALDNTNIEDMNPLYGEIVRTYMSGREGKTLKCLQPKRENSIYIQYYPNEVGSDSTVRVSNKTFASWFDYKSLFGCTDAGATALLPNGSVMYFDNNSGVFIYSGGNGQMIVSEIDPDTGKDYKFRTKTKQLAKAYNESPTPMVRTYVNETVGEVGFAFKLQKIDLIGTETNPDQIDYDDEFFISNDGTQYELNDLIEIVDISSGDTLYTGNVTGISGNTINVGPDPIFYTIPADTAVIKRSRYVYYNDHVVFDYVNMRWRSTYDYNFILFCNFGQTLVGWGENNQLYLHNQPGEWTFHGDPFIQKVKFVSNENPLLLKRYQDITLISDDKFSIEASSEPNRNYPLGMKTMMTENLLGMFEGYGKTNYRKNLYDPKFWVSGNVSTTNSNTWTLNGNQTTLNGEMITIVQDDKNIYTGIIDNPVYSSVSNTTEIELVGLEPNTYGVEGKWYLSERVLLNGEDVRANALTHTLSYDPAAPGASGEGSVLFSVGIKGVLS